MLFIHIHLSLTKRLRIISCVRFKKNQIEVILGGLYVKKQEKPTVFCGVFVYYSLLHVLMAPLSSPLPPPPD
jgi:hypothetical protein